MTFKGPGVPGHIPSRREREEPAPSREPRRDPARKPEPAKKDAAYSGQQL